MNEPQELFSHAATVFHVSDMQRSLDFYKNKLGFTITFEWNDPVDYAVLKRGEVSIHLSKKIKDQHHPSQQTSLYIFVYQVDEVHQELKEKGLDTLGDLTNAEYGMRDFDIKDPDGYMITIGQGK